MSQHTPEARLATPLTLNTEGDPGCSACAKDGVKAWIVTDAHGKELINHGHDTTIDYDFLPLIVTAVNEYDANKAKIEALTEALKSIVCRRCENRIGYTGPTTLYGDWRSCSSCAPARAALEGV